MSIFRKSLEAITIQDLEALRDFEARETAELEFKGTLPFIPQKGSEQKADRWIEKGDRVGDYARDQILAELVAFANAEGGTLVIGMHESKDEPRRATKLATLPNCESLASRLSDAAEDLIEPRFPALNARALPVDDAGSGYVVIRVGKSSAAPHRLKSTREFYVRRGERAAKMDVREIKELTLELARTGDRIESSFRERKEVYEKLFNILVHEPDKGGPRPLLIRVSALPVGVQTIQDITSRPDLWWLGRGFTMQIDRENYECSYPAREFMDQPQIRLRSLITNYNRDEGGPVRLLRGDGLVEFCLVHPSRAPLMSGQTGNRFYIGWLLSIVVGAIAQTHHLRSRLAWDSVEYGIEIEILSEPPLQLAWNDRGFLDRGEIKSSLPLLLPRYSVPPAPNYDYVVQAVLRDLFNATGSSFNDTASVPWSTLGVGK